MSHTGVAQVFQQLSHRAFGVHENLPTRNSGRNNVLEDRMMPDSELIDKSWACGDVSVVFAALNALQASPAEALDDRFFDCGVWGEFSGCEGFAARRLCVSRRLMECKMV